MIPAATATRARLRVALRGAVQGVGFRPFLHRLACELDLAGFVRNGPEGVLGEFEGAPAALAALLERIPRERPPRAAIHGMEHAVLDPVGYRGFEIRASATGEAPTAVVPPDIATCADCLREMFDPADRRHRYPFINCTHCGPRFTLIESLPYDRPRTTMRAFPLCRDCRAEYEDPANRRFHAQPVACPACGPRLELCTASGVPQQHRDQALRAAAGALRDGKIVAVKGVGGFHLMADARNDATVRRLRERKGHARGEKPFAVLYPSLDAVRAGTQVTSFEEDLLASPEAPIVLVRRGDDGLAPSVAPGNPYLGLLLPSSPVHHLLTAELGFPLVATSGNLSEEPICTGNAEAFAKLGGIADLFLVHDRPIARPVDDSIVRVMAGRAVLLRRARGHAPLPIAIRGWDAPPALALGAQLKGSVAISVGESAVLSQHLGDLGSAPAFENFRDAIRDMAALFGHRPRIVACDLHPDYGSTRHAAALDLPVVAVQHHHAHVLSCMAENEIDPPALGVAWDGTGFGPDGTVWGGEFLGIDAGGFERVAHLRTFGLPGGEKAVVEPRRSALGVLFEMFGPDLPGDLAPLRAFEPRELAIVVAMLEKGLHTPRTSSAGRLFDAVAALLGLRQRCSFEGQAAMDLEFCSEGEATDAPYDGAGEDWAPLIGGILGDLRRGVPVGRIAARFHSSLAEAIVSVARRYGAERVVLTGGCFQNRALTERAVRRLGEEGFRPYWHQRVPPNDGGIALGQLAAVNQLDRLGRR